MVVSPRKRNNSEDTSILPSTNVHSRFYHLLNNLLYRKMLFKFIPNKNAIHSKFFDKVFKNIFNKHGLQ